MSKVEDVQKLINEFEVRHTYTPHSDGNIYNEKEDLIKRILQDLLNLIKEER